MKEGEDEKKWLSCSLRTEGDSETTFDTLLLRIDNIIDYVQRKTKFCSRDAMPLTSNMKCLNLLGALHGPHHDSIL